MFLWVAVSIDIILVDKNNWVNLRLNGDYIGWEALDLGPCA